MKHYFLLLFTCSIISIYGNARKVQTIAVYNVDSVMATMPEYSLAVKEYMKLDSLVNRDASLMEKDYQHAIAEFARDSSKWSPLIRELKIREMTDIVERIHQYRNAVFIELENKKKEMLRPIREKIAQAAVTLGKEKGFLSVICEEGFVERIYFNDGWMLPRTNPGPNLLNKTSSLPMVYTDPKIKTVNITGLLIEKMRKV